MWVSTCVLKSVVSLCLVNSLICFTFWRFQLCFIEWIYYLMFKHARKGIVNNVISWMNLMFSWIEYCSYFFLDFHLFVNITVSQKQLILKSIVNSEKLSLRQKAFQAFIYITFLCYFYLISFDSRI